MGEIGLKGGFIIHERGFGDLPIVEGGDDAVDSEGDGEDGESGGEGIIEDSELPKEASSGRDTNE